MLLRETGYYNNINQYLNSISKYQLEIFKFFYSSTKRKNVLRTWNFMTWLKCLKFQQKKAVPQLSKSHLLKKTNLGRFVRRWSGLTATSATPSSTAPIFQTTDICLDTSSRKIRKTITMTPSLKDCKFLIFLIILS